MRSNSRWRVFPEVNDELRGFAASASASRDTGEWNEIAWLFGKEVIKYVKAETSCCERLIIIMRARKSMFRSDSPTTPDLRSSR